MTQSGTDPLARIHRDYRSECIRLGTYRPITAGELIKEEARWRAEFNRIPKQPTRKRKHPPKGHAD